MIAMDDLIKALLAMGPGGVVAAVFAVLWRITDKERKEMTLKLIDQGAQSIAAEKDMAASLQILAGKVGK
jgi:hypothetical protein